MKKSYMFILACLLIYSCSPKLYTDEKNRYQAGTLSDSQFDSLKTYLRQNNRAILQDTIIIKYDFNKDNCWIEIQNQNAAFLNNVRWTMQQNIIEKGKKRPMVAIYQYREIGERFSPVRSKGLEIETDSGFLKKILFNEITTCGTSAIILPDGKYLLVKSDPQFYAISMNKEAITKQLFSALTNPTK
ncbi:hypothetical protein [Pedobacter sandarakinus]|uniref:hypothetical protein n=1 Tax=Pedobacter sandarakinus TaxID=353156 RepID=UPI002248250D|nr:hypothetical protein [Pedobacter sandarakinus]MCX2574657.1 hypothetical protein [Pedobacter sandarakinus]